MPVLKESLERIKPFSYRDEATEGQGGPGTCHKSYSKFGIVLKSPAPGAMLFPHISVMENRASKTNEHVPHSDR